MKNLFVAIILALEMMAGCSSAQNVWDYSSFSKRLYKLQRNENCGFSPKDEYKQRNKVKDQLTFINFSSDTVYVIKSFVLSEGCFYEAIWTNKEKLEFKWNNLQFEIGSEFFIRRLYPMVEKWDIAKIKEEENKNGGILDGASMMGMRLIIENGVMRMDCIAFQEFFDKIKDP